MWLSRARFTLRRLLIVVAIVGLAPGFVIHVQVLINEEDDFAAAILFLEGVAVAILLAITLGIGFLVRSIRRDNDYSIRLGRNDVPDRCPYLPH